MKTIEQAAQECAVAAVRWCNAPNINIEQEVKDITWLIAAAMREVCEPLEREAKAQGEHAVAMTEHAQSLQAALAEAKAEVARLMADSEALDFAMAECNKLRAALTVAEGALNALKENDPEENRQHADEIANKALARIAKLRK